MVVPPSRVDGDIARVVEDGDLVVVELWDGSAWIRDATSPVTIRDVLVAPPVIDFARWGLPCPR